MITFRHRVVSGVSFFGELLRKCPVFVMDICEHSGYKDFVWAVELNRFGLELIGLWPKINQAVKESFSSDLRVGIIFSGLFLSIIPFVHSLKRTWGDVILMIDNLQFILPFTIISLKLLIMRWKRTVLTSILTMMAEDWMGLRIEAERNVMRRQARIARRIMICGYVLVISGFIIFLILPSFGVPFRHLTNSTDRARLLPLQTYFFYDTNKSPQFELTFVVQAIILFSCAISYTSTDCFLGLTIFHICGQLENFRRRLNNLVYCKDFDGTLRNNVETHLRLIRFAAKIEDMFAFMMLGLVFYFGIILCLYGFLLLTVITGDGKNNISLSLPRICSVGIGGVNVLAHTFLYYGAGEIIAEHCEAVYRAMYDLDWYKLESRKARNLIILMIRANEPFRITAGKIFPLTMATFCTLLKTSAGYVSFLLAKRG